MLFVFLHLTYFTLGASMLSQMAELYSLLRLSNSPVCVCVCMCVCVCVCNIVFIHLSISGHLSCLHVWATVNNAAMNIKVHESFLVSVFMFFGKNTQK